MTRTSDSRDRFGFDLNRFVADRSDRWQRLEQLLLQAERLGVAGLSLEAARELGRLYRTVSSDLLCARTESAGAYTIEYLNDIVARAYGVVHGPTRQERSSWWQIFTGRFPRTFRRERCAVILSALILAAGAGVGALFVHGDPQALGALIPESHQSHTPHERIANEHSHGGEIEGDAAAAFSGFLFTHNIQVTFLLFALGITFGVGTVALLFYNGVPLGALAMQYHHVGEDLFFWAWILPHGIPELTVIVIAGAAGMILGRAQWIPGRRTRREALLAEARTAAVLIVGGMPLLVLAGTIEGTISQMHAPAIAYSTKLTVAGVVGAAVYAYLLRAGRAQKRSSSPPRSSSSDPVSSSADSKSSSS
ncbi:MAG: stage II sporulation protein M [Myxococcales bacterium]|nr:stage II sporulation protein M [Myxococcales bacterium]